MIHRYVAGALGVVILFILSNPWCI